jgi:hypothetical protein
MRGKKREPTSTAEGPRGKGRRGFWILVSGFWFLVSGCWMLVRGSRFAVRRSRFAVRSSAFRPLGRPPPKQRLARKLAGKNIFLPIHFPARVSRAVGLRIAMQAGLPAMHRIAWSAQSPVRFPAHHSPPFVHIRVPKKASSLHPFVPHSSPFVPHSRSKSLPLSKSLPAMLRAAMQAGPSLMVSWSHSLIVSKSQSLAAQPLSDASSTCCRSSELPGCFETVNMTEG